MVLSGISTRTFEGECGCFEGVCMEGTNERRVVRVYSKVFNKEGKVFTHENMGNVL